MGACKYRTSTTNFKRYQDLKTRKSIQVLHITIQDWRPTSECLAEERVGGGLVGQTADGFVQTGLGLGGGDRAVYVVGDPVLKRLVRKHLVQEQLKSAAWSHQRTGILRAASKHDEVIISERCHLTITAAFFAGVLGHHEH